MGDDIQWKIVTVQWHGIYKQMISTSETHLGLDTRDGKLLCLELQFKEDPALELKRKDKSVCWWVHLVQGTHTMR